jgi:3',5'-cyclic AMP phosphodiesterase CpdA
VRTLVHLSDLHFGRIDHALLEPLRHTVVALKPHVVVVSGDLTQRAKPHEFREARRFLDTLPGPHIVVPGNHDVPFYNVFQRFFTPLAKFRRFISEDLEPAYVDDEIAVIGLNTARSSVFKGGRVNEEQVERTRERLCALSEDVTKIVVSHHPFDLPEHHGDSQIVGRARMAMRMFARCGADILLAGHMHTSHTGHTAARYKLDDFSALVVQAGTATSTRGRGEANSFNALYIEGREARVDRIAWDDALGDFSVVGSEAFERTANSWIRKSGA